MPQGPSPRHGHRLGAWLPLALVGLALPLPALADRPERRMLDLQHSQRLEAQAFARLSPWDRRRYFEALRQLERRDGEQRLAELRQLEDCLERPRQWAGAERCFVRYRYRAEQQRQQGLIDLAALRQRYRLPALPVAGGLG
jgi:hypothetical protein